MFKNILLLLDGTVDEGKISPFLNKLAGTNLAVVYAVNSEWTGILGDEWISSPWTRDGFIKYMSEKQLQEARGTLDSIEQKAEILNIHLKTVIKAGDLKSIIHSLCSTANEYDAVIIAADISKNKAAQISKILPYPVFMGPL